MRHTPRMEHCRAGTKQRRDHRVRVVRKETKMRSRGKIREHRYRFSRKVSGPRPCDFPIGSVQSRAAARAVVLAHVEQERKELEAEFGKDVPQILLIMEG